jgi:hypothetical protein
MAFSISGLGLNLILAAMLIYSEQWDVTQQKGEKAGVISPLTPDYPARPRLDYRVAAVEDCPATAGH